MNITLRRPRRSQLPLRRCAFTLVELLVVIGIIALLISILLPVLSSARRNALGVKCLSNLHQCFNALLLYAQDNKGFIIPVRAGGGALGTFTPSTSQTALANPYSINGIKYGAPSNVPGVQTIDAAWWMVFLAPYLSKQSKGGPGDLSPFNEAAARSTCFWCPGWAGVTETRAAWIPYGDIVHERTGYSMSHMLSFDTNYPGAQLQAGSRFPPIAEWANAGLKVGTSDNSPDPTLGKWWRLTQITHPAERCFMGDCYHLFLMAPVGGPVPPGPQQLLPLNDASSAFADATDSLGQCTFDWYRHGQYPGVNPANANTFSPSGGKLSYNILYFDGHVVRSIDKTDGYKAIRMRYPG